MSDDDKPDDGDVFDISKAKVQSWESKDRTVSTYRMSDPTGLCDMKIYLLLRAKLIQMEIELGFHSEEHDAGSPH